MSQVRPATGSAGAAADEPLLRRHQVAGPLLLTAVLVALAYGAADRLIEDVLDWDSLVAQAAEVAVMVSVTSLALWGCVLRPLLNQVRAERGAAERRRIEIEAGAQHQRFESQLLRALEMAGSEDATYRSTEKALRAGLADRDAELLLADSSDAHLKRVLSIREDGAASCGVVSPHDCPAVRRSQSLVFPSSEALDACPHLEGRGCGPVSAACVPMSVAGRTIGVLHVAAAAGRVPDAAELQRAEAIATHAGARIGMLRVMSATTLQAATDPLTGLLNRRSLENRLHDMARRGVPYALAMGDLDHFKRLNDTHGHDAGDRALRLFARTMLRILRAEDLVCRFGGEEFVVVFPERSLEDAVTALERLQQELLLALTTGAVPSFTASFGVAHSDDAPSFEDLCRVADAALFRAKRGGRNRIVADNPAAPAAG